LNRNLLLFSLFLIILGLGFGIYLVSLFGVLMLIPALTAKSRPPPRPVTPSPRQESRRIIPLARPEPSPAPQGMSSPPGVEAQPKPMVMTSSPQPSAYQNYSPAIFPNSMFSYLSPSPNVPTHPPETQAKKPSEKDELIETGAMLAILKLLLG
jgi:hypothetical protein